MGILVNNYRFVPFLLLVLGAYNVIWSFGILLGPVIVMDPYVHLSKFGELWEKEKPVNIS